jgi:hypothetical protein
MTTFILKLAGLICSAGLIFVLAARLGGGIVPYDALAYILADSELEYSLKLHDRHRNMSATLASNVDFYDFSFSADGRLAFSLINENYHEIYIADSQSADVVPLNSIQNSGNYLLAWSHDGRYMAFTTSIDDQNLLKVWDGETVINITPDNVVDSATPHYGTWNSDGWLAFSVGNTDTDSDKIYVWNGKTVINITPDDKANIGPTYDLDWSSDGRLAFSMGYRITADKLSSEIYLWDGNSIINLSQNPSADEVAPTWSDDGRLAFQSRRDDDFDILVWDGVSLKEGLPDTETFINIAPELSAYYSFPRWTRDGRLVFISQGSKDSHAQIYAWDGETVTDISQNPTLHNGSPVWSEDGRWAWTTFFSSRQLLYVRDADNRTLLVTEGESTPAWSLEGQLMFCKRGTVGWILSVWDGQQIAEIAQGREIRAQWPGGAGVACSSG